MNAQTKVNFITDYYPFTNKAEIYITKGEFENALEMYQKAFKNNTIGFSNDYENALHCALKIDKINIALEYAKQIATKGFDLNHFKKYKCFEKLINSKEWIDFEKNYDKYYLKNANKFLIDTLTKMANLDQEYRIKNYPVEEVQKIDSTNISNLISIFKKYGYPSEDIIGNQHLFSVILRHHYKTNNLRNRPFLDSLLFEAIKDGKVHNENVVMNLTRQIENSTWDKYRHNKFIIIQKVDTLVFKIFYSDNYIKEVDKIRAKIGLCNTKELEQKLLFYYNDILYKKIDNFMEATISIYKQAHPFYFWVHSYILYTPDAQYDFKQQTKSKKMIPIPNPNKK
ncbi:MAG: hypothetical protein EAZ85_07345 [Bacteroidetes bacterium]|nr:MAG: hypothetical protein EAZ85_07345 [Bacteroidota bacterium]TAG89460.1 MAG: hypothetical protein EAZ20_06415 [Bacteroidota bacterium]